jgi:hypothetical protein
MVNISHNTEIHLRSQIAEQDKEIIILKGRASSDTALIESQKGHIRNLQCDLATAKADNMTLCHNMDDKDSRISELEADILHTTSARNKVERACGRKVDATNTSMTCNEEVEMLRKSRAIHITSIDVLREDLSNARIDIADREKSIDELRRDRVNTDRVMDGLRSQLNTSIDSIRSLKKEVEDSHKANANKTPKEATVCICTIGEFTSIGFVRGESIYIYVLLESACLHDTAYGVGLLSNRSLRGIVESQLLRVVQSQKDCVDATKDQKIISHTGTA